MVIVVIIFLHQINLKGWCKMAVFVPSGQTTQLVGLPPLPPESYANLDKAVADVYALYVKMAAEVEAEHTQSTSRNPSDYYSI